jgi:hypothetical protein
VLILVDTVDHALRLRKFLPEFFLCYNEQSLRDPNKRRFYARLGLMEMDEPIVSASMREELRQKFKNRELMGVIATSVWARGVSFDSLEILIRADGGASDTRNIQLPGRVGRIDPVTKKAVGLLIDCYDAFDDNTRDRSDGRRRSYGKRGWTQYMENGKVWEPRSRG